MQLILGKKMTPVGDELGCKDRSLIFFFFQREEPLTLPLILSSLCISLLTPFIKAFNQISVLHVSSHISSQHHSITAGLFPSYIAPAGC